MQHERVVSPAWDMAVEQRLLIGPVPTTSGPPSQPHARRSWADTTPSFVSERLALVATITTRTHCASRRRHKRPISTGASRTRGRVIRAGWLSRAHPISWPRVRESLELIREALPPCCRTHPLGAAANTSLRPDSRHDWRRNNQPAFRHGSSSTTLFGSAALGERSPAPRSSPIGHRVKGSARLASNRSTRR